MKKILFIVAVCGLWSDLFAKVVVGQVDIQRVLVTVKQGKKVRDKLKKSFDKKQTEIKKGEEEIRKMQQDFQKQMAVLNNKAKSKRERDIQEKILRLQQKTVGYRQEMEQMEQKFKGPILERVRKIIDLVSKKANVDITVESSTSAVIYAKNSKDLTGEVIKAYDKAHK